MKDIREKLVKWLEPSTDIKRSEMPQINLDSLVELGLIDGELIKIKVSDLKPTQCNVRLSKIKDIIDDGKIKEDTILISADNHIADGHHRIAALYLMNPESEVSCHKSGLNIHPLINKLQMIGKAVEFKL